MIATGKVSIDPSKIPGVEIKILCQKLIPHIEDYLSDPVHRAECDAWIAKYREKKAKEKEAQLKNDEPIND